MPMQTQTQIQTQVLINPDKLEARIHLQARPYSRRIKEYITDLSRPMTVYGILESTDPTNYGDDSDIEGIGISYYLVQVNHLPNGEQGIASYSWARRHVQAKTHTWESYNTHPVANTLDEFETIECSTQCYWLPVFYTMPVTNKHVKTLLTKFDD